MANSVDPDQAAPIGAVCSCADAGIFVRGGPDKKSSDVLFIFFFFSPQLILQKSNGQFRRNLSFFKVPEGVQHSPGGVQLFPGGVQLLIPYRNPYNLCFSGGSGPPVPPLDPHLLFWVHTVCFFT